MKTLNVAAILGSLFILMSCATQPAAAPPKADPRVGQLQDQLAVKNATIGRIQAELDDLKQSDAEKDAELISLNAKLDALQKTYDDLSVNIGASQKGITKSQADYLAQIAALSKDKAALQDRINQLEKDKSALQLASQKAKKDMDGRIAQLKNLFAKEIAHGDLDIREYRDTLIVSVKDSVLFAPDSPTLKPESLKILNGLSDVFKTDPSRVVRVEGNTAEAISSPASLKLYPTSWHLGAARSANVVQYLQEKCGMDPLRLVAASLGEYRPRADNSTEAGKAVNRRVDFVLVASALYDVDQLKAVAP
jgi:chemotaxis protein MotB